MTDDVQPRQRPGQLPAGLPGSRRAPCLGCGHRVVQARDGWVEISGTRDGSYLIARGTEPMQAYATDPTGPPDQPVFLLGVAHHGCVDLARERIQAGTADIAMDLPTTIIEQGDHLPEVPYTLNLPAQSDACPFCGSTTGLTQEHVWPDWFSRWLLAQDLEISGDLVARSGRINVTVPVCGTCNNDWMSVIENDAGPLLKSMMAAGIGQGPSLILSPSQRRTLATWAVKTAYLIDAYQEPLIPRGFLHELALQRIPNESTLVWVGGYSPDVAILAQKRALDFPGTAGPTRNSPNGFVVTFTIFSVLFQVLGHFNGGPAVQVGGRSQYAPALFGVWPTPDTDLRWPPSYGFSRTSWDGLLASIAG